MVRRLLCTVACFTGLGLEGVGGQTIELQDIDSGLASPLGNYRWLDIADQAYRDAYRTNYNYTQAGAVVALDASNQPVHGTLTATNLKPNFAYQLKWAGTPGTTANERIGWAGRYWQEEWDGAHWANGQNLNNKGTGYSPTPNDQVYLSRRDIPDATSPTDRHYQYTCYLVHDYFITDSLGNATVNFLVDSSYHVLWKTSQQARGPNDGPLKTVTFDASPSQPAYSVDYPERTASIFGEWERLPTGARQLLPGQYQCQIVLTEESFHGSGGQYAGGWAAAMGGNASFRLAPRLTNSVLADGVFSLEIADCYVGLTNTLERSFDLEQPNGWQSVFTFVSTTPRTNWSENSGSQTNQAFYRVASPVSP